MKSPRSVAASVIALLHSAITTTPFQQRCNRSKIQHFTSLATFQRLEQHNNKYLSIENVTGQRQPQKRYDYRFFTAKNDDAGVAHNGMRVNRKGINGDAFLGAIVATGAVTAAVATNSQTSLCENQNVNTNTPLSFPEECLKEDHYNGVTVNVSTLPNEIATDPDLFQVILRRSLHNWKRDGKRGIWISLPTANASLVAPCVELGFDFQHAARGKVILTKWLPEDSESRLPLGPTHQVGVGAVVIHPVTKKILVVQEKSGPAAAKKLWKMPTGLTDPGEDITDAAIREIMEETNLKCNFSRILCFRQAHGGLYQQSDMFFVCLLTLDDDTYGDLIRSGKDIELIPQEEEIAEIKWMSVEEYAAQGIWQGSPLYGEMNQVLRDVVSGEKKVESCFVGKRLDIGWRPGANTIYLSKL